MTPTSRRAIPVFYLQHGGGEDERVWIEMGRTNVILDNLLAQGKVKPMIVVMETSATGGAGSPRWQTGDRRLLPQPAARAVALALLRALARPQPGRGFPGIGGPGGGAYGQFMTADLIPWIDKNFRTIPTRTIGPWRGSRWAACRLQPSPWLTSTSSPTSASSAVALRRAGLVVDAVARRGPQRPRPRLQLRSTSRPSTTAKWQCRRSSTRKSRFSS